MRQNIRSAFIIIICIYLAFGNFYLPFFSFYNFTSQKAEAAVPSILNYQGRLQNASGSLLGGSSGTNFNFRFSIWNTLTPPGGIQLWPSSTPATTTFLVRQGLFDARIGDSEQGFAALDFNFNTSSKVYLQVDVYNTSTASYETMSPRQPIVSSGFAINADTVDGFHAGTSSNNVLTLDSGGNINLPGGQIRTINSSDCTILSALGGGAICYGTNTNQLYVFNSASSSWVSLGGSSSTASTLQQTYEAGNIINTTNARDLQFNLVDTATDSNFVINLATSTTGAFIVRDNGINEFVVNSSSVTVSSPVSMQGFTFTNATGTGNLQTATLNTTGLATLNSLTVTNNATVSGITSLQGTTFTNATGTGNLQTATLNTTGNVTIAGTGSFQGFTFTNATGTGNLQA
ncbi:MAG: hypothetical protein HYW34_01540, partial [Candidatus Brennerbacteria bacterium]|nr:hypothetical protein [Candidatus Brennerbacteria bacterium]